MRKIFKRISYALLICLLILSSINPIYAESGDEIELTIFHTTDTHGRIENMGKIFHIINESRENSSNVLILDSGDTIQGNLPAFYFKGEHALKIMDAMSYDAITLGNHDFNFGKDMLTEKSKEVDFPFLSANIIEEKDSIDYVGKSIEAAKPYIIKDINGIKVAILGLTTPTIKMLKEKKTLRDYSLLTR